MVLTYPGLRHLALCILQTNVLRYWLVTSTVQCIPLHHKMYGFEGMVSDIVTVCWFLISLPFINIQMLLQRDPFIVLMNCSMFKEVIDVYVCMYFYKYEYIACDQNKWMLNIFLSYLQLLIMNISFVSMTYISYCQVCFSKRCFSCC
jgi:hypothetical protein